MGAPSRYVPPLVYPEGLGARQAAARLGEALEAMGAGGVRVSALGGGDGGLLLEASASGWGERMEFVLRPAQRTVAFSIEGRRQARSLFDPPGCLKKGCINGPPQRARVEALQAALGWAPLETDEDKEWVPLLLH